MMIEQKAEERAASKGPWTAHGVWEGGLGAGWSVDDDCGEVAFLHHSTGRPSAKADAYLIAATPDLLAVAEMVLALADAEMSVVLIAAASAAIKKASAA